MSKQDFSYAYGNSNEKGSIPEEGPSAPPINQINMIPGYEQATFSFAVCPPPSYDETIKNDYSVPIPTQIKFTEEEVRNALEGYVDSKLFYRKKGLKEINIREITMNSAYHYKLVSFTEKRETKWKYKPYSGPKIYRDSYGPVPSPWQIHIVPQASFEKSKTKCEVPNSAYSKKCYKCHGYGKTRCTWCNGRGNPPCTWCNGSGRSNNGNCSSCNGSGCKRCTSCNASGHVRCTTCNGLCALRYYLELKVLWDNHIDEYISDRSEVPEKFIKKVSGNIVFDDRQPRVYAIMNFPDSVIAQVSRTLIEKHSHFSMEHILEQHHNIKVIPVANVKYTHKSNEGTFFVFGLEKKVYFPNYPSKFLGCVLS